MRVCGSAIVGCRNRKHILSGPLSGANSLWPTSACAVQERITVELPTSTVISCLLPADPARMALSTPLPPSGRLSYCLGPSAPSHRRTGGGSCGFELPRLTLTTRRCRAGEGMPCAHPRTVPCTGSPPAGLPHRSLRVRGEVHSSKIQQSGGIMKCPQPEAASVGAPRNGWVVPVELRCGRRWRPFRVPSPAKR